MFRARFQNWQPSGFLVLEAQIDYHFHPHYFHSKKGISLFLHQKLKWASLSPKKAEKYSLVNMHFSAKLTLPALMVFCSMGPKLSCHHVFQFVAPGAYVGFLKPEKCVKIFLLTLHICLELIFKTGSHQDFWFCSN